MLPPAIKNQMGKSMENQIELVVDPDHNQHHGPRFLVCKKVEVPQTDSK